MHDGTSHNRRGIEGLAGWQLAVGLLPTLCLCTMFGCAAWTGREPLVTNPLVDEYREYAERESVPNLNPPKSGPSPQLGSGRPLVHYKPEDLRQISLTEAVDLGIRNNTILRQNAQFLSPSNPIMVNPDGVPSVYDPAIQNNGVLFGSRGVEAAASDFDPRLIVNSTWGRDQNVQNSIISTTGPPGTALSNDSWQFQARLEQQTMSGGTFALKHDWTYSDHNARSTRYTSRSSFETKSAVSMRYVRSGWTRQNHCRSGLRRGTMSRRR